MPRALSPEQRRMLLELAHAAVEAAVRQRPLPAWLREDAALSAPGAAFVTLRDRSGELRGCRGEVMAVRPLAESVIEGAVAAALDDPRFPPVSEAEPPSLTLEISVLTPMRPARPEEIEVPRHGVMITSRGRRGLLLPAEPVQAVSGKYAGVRAFKGDEDRGLALFRALSESQRVKTVIAPETTGEDFTTAFRENLVLDYKGITFGELSSAQHDLLLGLVDYHIGRLGDGHSLVKMDEVKRHLNDTYFCWMGGDAEDGVFYYRVQSPVVIVEFDPQRGIAFGERTKPYKDHIHVILRTPNGNDYGKDLLRLHYQQGHHATGR